MFYWIYDIPTPTLALYTVAAFVGFYLVGCLLFRPILRLFLGRQFLTQANDIVGSVLSCFGVFYGLLLGLIAVAAYQNSSNVEEVVALEAAALRALYQDVSAYPEPHRQNLRWILRDYCRYVIKYAWPLQRKGIIPEDGNIRINTFHERLLAFQPKTASEEINHAETLRQFNVMLERQQQRLHSVNTGIPAVLWYVVIVGAIVNIAMIWLFEMNFPTQLILGGLLTFFLGSMIFIIAAMDNPFRGEVSISPDAFRKIYETQMTD